MSDAESLATKKLQTSDSKGKVSQNVAEILHERLSNRADRQELIDRMIIRGTDDVKSFRRTSATLNGLLSNRPTRERLKQLNVIKEENGTSHSLIAAKQELQKAQKKKQLQSLLESRPNHSDLMDRRIIVDERETFRMKSAKNILQDFVSHRPKMDTLIEQKILSEVDKMPQPAAALHNGGGWIATPERIEGLNNIIITEVKAGWSHSLVLDVKGMLYAFGSCSNGRLGNNETTGIAKPTKIESLAEIGPVSTFATGDGHSAAVLGGKLYTWGDGSWGRLGVGDAEDRAVPTLVEGLPEDVISVDCGGYHTVVLTQSKRVYTFGWNKQGRLGLGNDSKSVRTSESPVEVTSLADEAVIHVYAGCVSSAALTADGALYTWGSGSYGILGHGDEREAWQPTRVAALEDEHILRASVGEYHMAVTTKSGRVLSWGRNDHFQLGRAEGDVENFRPGEVVDLAKGKTESLSCGKYQTMAVNGGKLYSWGKGSSGVLGNGDTKDAKSPTVVKGIDAEVVSACTSWSHSLACTADGAVFSFGSKSNGQLG